MEPFEFRTTPGQSLTLDEALAQALAAASLCWNPKPVGSAFDEEAILAIRAALLAYLQTGDSVHVFEDGAGVYRWRRTAAGNFEKIASSGEAFSSKAAAIKAAARANPGMSVVVLP